MNLDKYEALILDCDGVLWKGPNQIPGSFQALQNLQAAGKKLFFLTNNPAKTPEDVIEWMQRFGYEASPRQVYCSGMATGSYLKIQYPNVSKIYLIGSEQFKSQLTRQGFQVWHATDLGNYALSVEDLERLVNDYPIDAVVVGHDTRFTYMASVYAAVFIQNGAKFLAASDDPYFVMEKGNNIPGCGTLTTFMETATGMKVEVVGKPKTFMLDLILQDNSLSKEKIIMIGDSMGTDIRMGYNANIDTLLVLSGTSSREDLPKFEFSPTFICPDLQSVLEAGNNVLE